MFIRNFLKNKKKLTICDGSLITPKSISIEVSDKCNLKCRICNQWKEKNNLKKIELKDFKRLVDEISEKFNDAVLEFSGPEPLTNQHLLFKILEYAKDKNVKTALSTNGSLINKEIAKKLIKCEPGHISTSLDSPEPDIQDYIRNCEGLFSQIIKSIKNLVEAKSITNSKTIISVTCTVTDYNAKDLTKVYDLCKSLSVDSVNYNAYAIDNSYFNKEKLSYENDAFWVKKVNIPHLKRGLKKIISIAKKGQNPIIATPEDVLKEMCNYFEKKELFKIGVCKAGLNYFHITNFGEVTICGKGPHLNIKDYAIKDILRSEEFNKTLIETRKCKIPCLNNCFHLE
jgi:MoaA/NifB/PqqE/SkfB family radical SAM enzyme